MNVSLLHATYGRPEKAVAAMRDAFQKAANPRDVEYIFAANEDDSTMSALVALLIADETWRHRYGGTFVGAYSGSVPAWCAAAAASTGHILVQMQDDLELPQDYDRLLMERVMLDVPCVVAVSDGFRKDNLLCTAIINRARYEQVGEFLYAGFWSVYSDDDFSVRAYSDAVEGKCVLINGRDLVFRHNNVYHLKGEPDATTRRQNSDAAYSSGADLFMARNAELVKRGFRTWG